MKGEDMSIQKQVESETKQEALLKMIEEYENIQTLIVDELKQKHNYGERCDCCAPYPKTFEYLADLDVDSPFKEPVTLCLQCGGEVLI